MEIAKASPDISTKSGRANNGRPKMPPLELARREGLKAKRLLEQAESEFAERIEAGGDDPAVRIVADKRLARAAVLNDARKMLSQARRDFNNGIAGAATRLEAAKAAEKAAWKQFRELPDLGFTEEEWAEDPSLRERPAGRAQLDVELKLIRAREALDEAMAKIKALEAELGVTHIPLNELKDPVKTARGKGIGRPKLDALGLLDRKLAQLEHKLEDIEAAPPENFMKSGGRGRAPLSKAARIKLLNQEISAIRKQIEVKEQQLDAVGKLEREIKKLRDERRRLHLIIRDNPDNCDAEKVRHLAIDNRVNEKLVELRLLKEARGDVDSNNANESIGQLDIDSINPEQSAARFNQASVSDDLAARRARAQAAVKATNAKFNKLLKSMKDLGGKDGEELSQAVLAKKEAALAQIPDRHLIN